MQNREERGPVDISIVISNYDAKGQLVACIEHALAQNGGAGEFEVIFPLHGAIAAGELTQLRAIEGGSTRLRLIEGDRGNRARALNDAVRGAAAEQLLFLESHVRAPSDLAGHYRRALQPPDVAAVQGAYAAVRTTNWVSETESRLRALSGERRRARGQTTDEFHLHSAGFRRSALLAAGGFDERVPGIAEVPLLQRILASGGRIVPLDTPAVHHINHDDFHDYVQALRRRGYEVGRLWRLDPGAASRLYPTALLERHGAFVRLARAPLRLAGQSGLFLASLMLSLCRGLRLGGLILPAAAKAASSAVRAGVLDGYCR